MIEEDWKVCWLNVHSLLYEMYKILLVISSNKINHILLFVLKFAICFKVIVFVFMVPFRSTSCIFIIFLLQLEHYWFLWCIFLQWVLFLLSFHDVIMWVYISCVAFCDILLLNIVNLTCALLKTYSSCNGVCLFVQSKGRILKGLSPYINTLNEGIINLGT